MTDFRKKRWISGAFIIAIVILFAVYKGMSGDDTYVSIGVDDEKIGVVSDDETTFIWLKDITDIDYTEQLDSVSEKYTFIGNESLASYIVINTQNEIYVINGSSKKQTKNTYDSILEHMDNL